MVDFVTDAYANLFDRTGDGDIGVHYWTTSIAKHLGIPVPVFGDPVVDNTAPLSPAHALLALINGAQGSDALTIAHKLTAGLYYADQLEANDAAFTQASAQVVDMVTFDPDSVAAAQAGAGSSSPRQAHTRRQ